jgi:alkylation response protein AidB-like acyl-CoA dehydrogenase
VAEPVDRFRAEVRAWLAGVDRPAGLRDHGATPTPADVPPGRAWQRLLADAGLACLAWPVAYGGRDATVHQLAAFAEECSMAGVPRQLNMVGPELVGPVLLGHATDEQRSRWLERIRTGEDMWCQLFSEPDAGSDLASVRTRAVPTDGGWVVDGSKVWSSGALTADLGLLLARTGDDRHDLSMFVVPMTTPGVEVRPLRHMDGESKFNEVLLDGVVLAGDALLGSVGDGWKLALSTLGTERLNLGAQSMALLAHLDGLLRLPGADGPVARDRATRIWIGIWLLRANFQRLLASGRPLSDPSFSVLKLWATEVQRELVRFGVGVLGARATAAVDALPAPAVRFLTQPGQTIAGGTSEIQRNILAERVLGLPR